ncbi:hypothetical protein [Streptomyces sp900116325]|uniref:hypothetical protein n=1 Tax=Streptomyces sp. 900116325 TaxID=3154295 RepID=UPI0033FCD9EB
MGEPNRCGERRRVPVEQRWFSRALPDAGSTGSRPLPLTAVRPVPPGSKPVPAGVVATWAAWAGSAADSRPSRSDFTATPVRPGGFPYVFPHIVDVT